MSLERPRAARGQSVDTSPTPPVLASTRDDGLRVPHGLSASSYWEQHPGAPGAAFVGDGWYVVRNSHHRPAGHDFEVDVRHGHLRDPTTVTYSTVTSLAHVGQSAALRVGADVTSPPSVQGWRRRT